MNQDSNTISNKQFAFRVVAGIATITLGVVGGYTLAPIWAPWVGGCIALHGIAALTEPLAIRTGSKALRLTQRVFYTSGLMLTLVVFLVFSPRSIAVVIGGIALILALAFLGVLPAYLVAWWRGLGLTPRDLASSPVRWRRAIWAVRIYDQLKRLDGDIYFEQIWVTDAAGVNLDQVVGAMEVRVASGRPPDFHALSAAALAGHSPVEVALHDNLAEVLVDKLDESARS